MATMPTAGLVLATLLALAPPDEAGDAVVITSEPAPTQPAPAPVAPPPAVAPAPAPTVSSWGPSADASTSVSVQVVEVEVVEPPPALPAIPRRPSPGAGLFFGGTVAFAIGVGIQMHEFGSAADVCGAWLERGYATPGDCFDVHDSPGDYLPVGMAFGSSIVMTALGSAALGQYEAWQTIYGDQRPRNRTPRLVGGAIMLGLGIAAFAAEGALLYADDKNPCVSYECHVNRRALWLGVADIGTVSLASGFGLLAHAGHYRKHLARYERLRWAVAPAVTPGSVGATAALRF